MPRGFASPAPSRGGGRLSIDMKVDAIKASADFKAARRDINAATKKGLLAAAEDAALPHVRTKVPSFARPHLIARATTRNAYITTKGPRWIGRTLGLLEYGGTVKTQILPKDAKALRVGPGIYRAAVNDPRHYKAGLRMTHAVEARRPQIEDAIEREVMKAFDGFRTD